MCEEELQSWIVVRNFVMRMELIDEWEEINASIWVNLTVPIFQSISCSAEVNGSYQLITVYHFILKSNPLAYWVSLHSEGKEK